MRENAAARERDERVYSYLGFEHATGSRIRKVRGYWSVFEHASQTAGISTPITASHTTTLKVNSPKVRLYELVHALTTAGLEGV